MLHPGDAVVAGQQKHSVSVNEIFEETKRGIFLLTCLLHRAAGGAVAKVAGYMGSRTISQGGAPGIREPTLDTGREIECIKLGFVTKVQALWMTPW